jgi:hypothetical protein
MVAKMNSKAIKKLLKENRGVDAEQMEKARAAIKNVRRIKSSRVFGYELLGRRRPRLVTAEDGSETAIIRRR